MKPKSHITNVSWIYTALTVVLWLPGAITHAQSDFQLTLTSFDSHSELIWDTPQVANLQRYRIYRSDQGESFNAIETSNGNTLVDFTGFPGDDTREFSYFVRAVNILNQEVATSDTVMSLVQQKDDDALLDMVQRYTFRYFWDFAHPVSGLARERNTSGDIVTMGGSGFGIMAIIVGIERGFITREQGRDRLLQIISFLQFADSYHGVFPHWMYGNTGDTRPFSQFDDGGDLVETAFLMQGLLCARTYFDRDDVYEDAIRQGITGLWEAVEWDFYERDNSGVLYWHWSPNHGWMMNLPVRGFNETMIVYLLAIASPTHAVSPDLWEGGWAGQNYDNGASWYGHKLFVGPAAGGPLFFAHYSFLGFDPRDKRDAHANYFDQNVNHTLINRAYCIDNPLNHQGYSEVCWGLTASDDPWGYLAHAPGGSTDNGTITPTAALSSMPYTPDESMEALKHFYRQHGERLWGEMGFFDAFNENADWYAESYLAIDQGPIIGMIENYRTGLLWDLFMANPEIQPALDAIGFVEDISSMSNEPVEAPAIIFPNPAGDRLVVQSKMSARVSLDIIDQNGNRTFTWEDGVMPGEPFEIDLSALGPGMYLVRFRNNIENRIMKLVKID